MKINKQVEIALNMVMLIALLWFAYHAFYELFVNVPGIHNSRFSTNSMDNGTEIVQFSPDVPTIVSVIILFTSVLSICFNLIIFYFRIFISNRSTKRFWGLQLIGFLICLILFVYQIIDFLSNAFSGVG